ncbi:lycopene cyclase domain-containing protein [Maribellus comscasis]|uniref:Lycopene cyclase domain-containing protein n=1 Tax=Maribellus comscasis TaxID=2681766 RepID=A0A6I6JV51_9BACT|nr:lycopene cyclase domain-containing protein [Maribellus comscasis]QGY44022.1 lycopene cyclase domain-containing protein [Maribellus comscasis]
MGLQNFVYVALLAVFFFATVGISLKRKDGFIGKMKYLLPAMLFSGAIFIIWDIRFTELGIWNFNPGYLLGISLMQLPLEEWLFFFVVPFFSVYIYEVLKSRLVRFSRPNIFVVLSLVLLVVYALIAYSYRKDLYTFFTFFLLTIYFGYTIFRNNFKKNYPKFYLSYLFALAPFLILRGILTGLPVVTFNYEHILNVFIFSIPIEDLGYFFLIHLMNITIFEYLSVRRFY